MSGDKSKGGRRRFSLDGETEEVATARRKVRALEEIFSLEGEEFEFPEGDVEVPTYDEEKLMQFMAGSITLGDLEGITKQEQYEMAKVGHSYLASGRLEQATTVFEGLLALDPFDAYFRMALASIAQRENRLDEADELYTKVLQINPFSPTAYANRGEIRVMLGRLAEGADDLIRAIEEDPQGAEDATVRARATLLVLQEQLGAQSEDLKKRAEDATGSKVRAVGRAVAEQGPTPRAKPRGGPRSRPRPRPRARPRPRGRAGARPRARRPGPRKK